MKKLSFIIFIILILATATSCQSLSSMFDTSEVYEGVSDYYESMQGFWMLTGADEVIDENIKTRGIAISVDGETIDTYEDFEITKENAALILSENDTIKYSVDGIENEVSISFDNRDGYNLMILENDDEEMLFEKITEDSFYLYKAMYEIVPGENKYGKTVSLYDDLTDQELINYVSDIWWFELYFMCSDGSTAEMDENTFILYSDGTGIDEFTDTTEYVTWDLFGGYIYIYYDDGSIFYSPIDYAYDAATGYVYLYLYDENEGYEGCAWIFYNLIE